MHVCIVRSLLKLQVTNIYECTEANLFFKNVAWIEQKKQYRGTRNESAAQLFMEPSTCTSLSYRFFVYQGMVNVKAG
jgi:aspartate carbamoyltransferase catalytic subunit